jgi:hypothetical protein
MGLLDGRVLGLTNNAEDHKNRLHVFASIFYFLKYIKKITPRRPSTLL